MPLKPVPVKQDGKLVLGAENSDDLVQNTEYLLGYLPGWRITSSWASLEQWGLLEYPPSYKADKFQGRKGIDQRFSFYGLRSPLMWPSTSNQESACLGLATRWSWSGFADPPSQNMRMHQAGGHKESRSRISCCFLCSNGSCPWGSESNASRSWKKKRRSVY